MTFAHVLLVWVVSSVAVFWWWSRHRRPYADLRERRRRARLLAGSLEGPR